jgi:probable rRNA maturation factor
MTDYLQFNYDACEKSECDFIEAVAYHLFRRAFLPKKQLSISFVDDNQMATLNGTYRGKEQTTDVLTFALFDDDLIGDILLSAVEVSKNAEIHEVSFTSELTRVVAHSFAHLKGYDHDTDADDRIMKEYEDFLLKDL